MQQRTQVDLVLDTIGNVPLKDDRALMEFPFFSLEKRPRMEPLLYDDGRVQIRISPGVIGERLHPRAFLEREKREPDYPPHASAVTVR